MKTFSIVIPVFNEERRLRKTFAELEPFLRDYSFSEVEVVFVSDGSTDRTAEMIAEFQHGRPNVKLIGYPENCGKGHAVRVGMLAAIHEYALILDADMSTSLAELPKFREPMEARCPVVIATRKAPGAAMVPPQPFIRRKLGEGYTLLARLITGVQVSDFTCGFKCFNRASREKIFRSAAIDRWSYDAEILFLAKQFGFPICEVPVLWRNDRDTRVRLGRDVIGSFIDLFRIRLKHQSPRFGRHAN